MTICYGNRWLVECLNLLTNNAFGAIAKWLGTGLQNLLHRFNSGSRLQLKINAGRAFLDFIGFS